MPSSPQKDQDPHWYQPTTTQVLSGPNHLEVCLKELEGVGVQVQEGNPRRLEQPSQ